MLGGASDLAAVTAFFSQRVSLICHQRLLKVTIKGKEETAFNGF